MIRPFRLTALVCVCTLFLSAGVGRAAHQFSESFFNTTYKDAVNTTADWNTGAGQLKLFPFVPSLVGSYDTPGLARGVAVAGDLAFVADQASGLQIFDITNPASPTLVGGYDTPGLAFGVVVAGDLAFVADHTAGLQIIDITNPASPTLIGTYNTPWQAYGVAVAGDLAFVADDLSGLRIIDITNPASPALVGTYSAVTAVLGVAVAGDLVFVADHSAGLKIINITNPASPTLVGSYDTPGLAVGVAVAGDLAFVADYGAGLQIIDVTNPASPTLAGGYDTPGTAHGIAVAGDLAFVADWLSGLQVINITNPASPTLVDSYDTPGEALGVAVAGDLAFVADQASGLQVVRVSHPVAIPPLVGSYDTSGLAVGVALSGDLAFVADYGDGLQVINITNPASPTLVGGYNTPGLARGISVAGDHAFVADQASGLQIIDITNPASPALVGTYDTPGTANGVAVAGDLAFVADDASGLQIIAITNPASPALVGTYDTPGSAAGVTVVGDLAFVADYGAGLQIINIGNPASPTLVGTYDTPGLTYEVAVAGDLAFVADYAAGLQVINIGNPASPTLVGSYDTPGSAWSVAVVGDLAFVADDAFGLQVINIGNPASPTLVGNYDTPAAAYSVAVDGDLAFVADWASGLDAIQVFQHEVDASRNIGRSLAVDGSADMILRVRLSSTQTAGVSWEVSANGGANWQAITPNNTWTFTVAGSDLRWRSTHTWPGVNPTVSDLLLEWLYDYGEIAAITDIPNDQGRWVRVNFGRSGRDFADQASLPITNYGVWRRVDNVALLATLTPESRASVAIDGAVKETFGGLPLFTSGDRVFVQSSAPGPMAAVFPPGTWELVQNVPALQKDSYLAAIPTEADSTLSGTSYTVLVVTAHTTTPSIWYASPPDSGYSIDNLAPSVPASFVIAYNTGNGNTLSWSTSPDADFQYFRVYRSTNPNFTPSPATLVHPTIANNWVDPDYDGGLVYYKVTAMDFAGNESAPASPGTVTAVGGPAAPKTFALYPNVPNPFNPTTVIRYDVPANGGDVSLRIYDVSGRVVKTLVSGTQSAGEKSLTWDGRDDRGQPSASGVYFYRLTAPGYTKTHKMVLMK